MIQLNELRPREVLDRRRRTTISSGFVLLGGLLALWMSTHPFPSMAAERFYFTVGLFAIGFGVVYALLDRV